MRFSAPFLLLAPVAYCLPGFAIAPLHAQAEAAPEKEEVRELADSVVTASNLRETAWLAAPGSVGQTSARDLVRMGASDLAGLATYDPTVNLPFDFASGDGAYAYGQSGYGSINIRGMEGNRITIELDGVRQPPQYLSTSFDPNSDEGAGGVGRDYFDPAMFEMIEVLKGGGSALYGSDALGGVVSLRTPDAEHFLQGKDWGSLVRSQYFSRNEGRATQIGGALRHRNSTALVLYGGRWGEETENNGRLAPNPGDLESHAGLVKLEHDFADHSLRFTWESYQRETFINARSAAESSFSPIYNDYVHNTQLLDRQRVGVRWNYDPQLPLLDSLESHLYWQEAGSQSDSQMRSRPVMVGGNPLPGTELRRDQTIIFDTRILGASTTARQHWSGPWNSEHSFTTGLSYSLETGENVFQRRDQVGTGTPLASDRISMAPADTTRVGLFFQDEIELGAFSLTPGLRLDWHSISYQADRAYNDRLADLINTEYEGPADYDNFSLAPRLTLSWRPNDYWQSYLSYSHGVRNPSAEELSMIFDHPDVSGDSTGSQTVPNPDLEEEKSHSFEWGLKGEGELGRVHLATFYTAYDDFVDRNFFVGQNSEGKNIYTAENVGEATIYGLELNGVLELGALSPAAEGWTLGGAAGLVRGRNERKDEPLNSVDPLQVIGYLGYEDPAERFGLRLTGTWTDQVRRVDDTTGQGEFFRPPSWTTVDLGLWWQASENLTLHAGVHNLFDEKYWAWGSVRRGGGHLGGNHITDRTTAPGRNFSLSATLTF
ncbi:TonB-dependent hemoglobin/transferrin/lactoferrin family receptor [Roseibacillus ishigakijimensis]|uniref:TonB-dependent hemoglobin/transferrin/lactoferrin family receptor n=1 Tax=Roseibacillus ishigakijimensis TaxID=454146 RepID=A0A934RN48_9BACT|nr:TonB-dependent hemoglobin/transferrin/lactoferrin family receptor [Roseibacillus ishigakijimensis]MBK1833873.1 TonB-dependent hemoglobin/transferrin/lactoferrin family receptor [Roseibacillus ishigakijimensis]